MRWGACCLGIRPLYSLLLRSLPLKIWKLFSWDGELVVLGSDPYTLFWLATFLLRFERCSLQIRNLAFSDQESDLFRSRNWRLQVRNLSKYQTLPIFRSGTLPLLITEMLIPKQETFLLRSGNCPPFRQILSSGGQELNLFDIRNLFTYDRENLFLCDLLISGTYPVKNNNFSF